MKASPFRLLCLSAVATFASGTVTANSDDLTASPLESASGISVYEGLLYSAFFHSSAATLLQQSSNGTPTITVTYPGSNSKSFTLYSFWFGCALHTDEAVAGVATQCSISVAGFRKQQEVAVASFTFIPPAVSVDAVPMIEAVLPAGFAGVQDVTVEQGDPTLQALIIDSVTFTLQGS